MPIEDFEWEGEVELTEPGRVAAAASADKRAWFTRLRESVWLEPALRLAAAFAFLVGLTGLGIIATTYAKPGVKLPETPARLAAVLGTSWLKPTPEAAADHEHGKAASAAASPPVIGGAASDSPARASEPGSSNAPATEPPDASNTPAGLTADGKVILNLASAEELTKLPGVGKKRAEAILALRTKLKRFRQVTELLRVKGIGPRGLKRMLPHLVLDAP